MKKSKCFFTPINEYEIDRPAYAELCENREEINNREMDFDEKSNSYVLKKDTALNEAVIICTGSIDYTKRLEKACSFNGDYQYKTLFKYLEKLMHEGDITISGFNSVATELYPSSGMISVKKGETRPYVNARPQFLSAIKSSGINVLATSSDFSMDLGLKGLLDTKKNLEKEGLMQVGLYDKGYKIISVNGIKIALISTTLSGDGKNYLTKEGKEIFINIYDKNRLSNQILAAKEEGAEFVLVYVNATAKDKKISLDICKDKGIEIAESGADYVVFTEKTEIGEYIEYVTGDGREVPICLSLGSLNKTGFNDKRDNSSAVIKIRITRKQTGGFFVKTEYIPCAKFKYFRGTPMATIPTISYFNGGVKDAKLRTANLEIRGKLGGKIQKNRQKTITGNSFTKPQLSVSEICEILEKPLPKGIKKRTDVNKKVNQIVERNISLKPGCVAVMEDLENKPEIYIPSIITIETAIENEALMVIASKRYKEIPTIVVDNPNVAYNKLMEAIRSKYNPLTVTVTGTVGKTTTKDLIGSILNTEYNTLYVKGNYNTVRTAGELIQKLTKKTEAYVQEMHEASPFSVHNITKICHGDVALITNLSEGHLDQIGSMEELIKETFRITDVLKPGSPLFLNYDNEILAKQNPDCKVVSYSSFNDQCDYYAKDVKPLDDRITFKIVSNEGVYDAVLFMQGEHNVNNAVGAFAVGRWAGVPPEKIIAAMSRYRTSGIRQNLIHHKGYDIIIDSYSCTPMSMRTAFKAFTEMRHPESGRKIGVVGDINGLGEKNNELHHEIGYDISKCTDVDMFFCFGEFSLHLYEGIKENTENVVHYKNREDFNKALANYLKPGDLLLFKASHPIGLEKTPESIFGLKLD